MTQDSTRTADGSPRFICPSCGYDITGIAQPPCPECGGRWRVPEDMHLWFQRPGWRVVLLHWAVALILIAVAWIAVGGVIFAAIGPSPALTGPWDWPFPWVTSVCLSISVFACGPFISHRTTKFAIISLTIGVGVYLAVLMIIGALDPLMGMIGTMMLLPAAMFSWWLGVFLGTTSRIRRMRDMAYRPR